jgi:small neutral amino acid transporter SnatA (MarC family)
MSFEYDDVEDNGSNQQVGAVVYSIMFAGYLVTLAVLAILGVNFIYFFAILLAGFPVSGIYLSMVQGIRMRKQNLAQYEPQTNTEPIVRTKNDQGYDIIEL